MIWLVPVLAFALAQSPEQGTAEVPSTKPANQNSQQHNSPPDQPPPSSLKSKTETDIHKNSGPDNAANPNAENGQELVIWSAVAQAASAIVIVILSIALLYYSHKAWKASQDSAEAAKRSADAAAQSVEIAARALDSVERPDVLVSQIVARPPFRRLLDNFAVEDDTVFTVTIKNYGRTTARGLQVTSYLKLDEPPQGSEPIKMIELPFVLGAGEIYEFSFQPMGNFFDNVTLAHISAGMVQLYIETDINYTGFNEKPYAIKGSGFYRESVGRFTITHTADTGSQQRPRSPQS